MNYHLPLLLLLFTFGTSESVRLVLQVENTFFGKNPIKLKAQEAFGHVLGKEDKIQYSENLTWEVTMDKYLKTLRCLCHVTQLEKSGDKETYLGSFQAFNAAWLQDSFNRLRPDQSITVLWYVFEEGAVTKLDPEIGGDSHSHRWLKIKYALVNEFDENVELSALNEDGSTVKKEIIAKGEALFWTHYVTSETKPFTYKCRASRVLADSVTEEIGSVVFFKSNSIDRKYLEEVGTLEKWWGVNNSGIRKYSPITGKYSKKEISWRRKS